jgi:hypothetical protein
VQESDAKRDLQAAYQRFMKEQEPANKNKAGCDLIRAIFGKNSIAEAPLK